MSHSQLSSLCEEYLAKNKRIKQATRDFTHRAFRYFLMVADCELEEIGYSEAEDYQAFLAGRMSKRSANSYTKTLSPMFSWAVRKGYMKENPFDKLPKFKITDKEVRTFNEAEVQAILVSARDMVWRARIIAALSAGLRRGEVLNLTTNDIDFEQQLIIVRPKKDTRLTWFWEPKDYEIRKVPLTAQLSNLLISSILPSIPAGQPYVMLTEKRYWTLQQRIGTLCERVRNTPDENFRPFNKIFRQAKIKDGCFHDLRRTAITNWARYLPIRDVQELAGHSSIETTEKYYLALGKSYLDDARRASSLIGATGLEPATS